MSDNTIIQQGSFTSTGAAVTLNLRSGVDWIRVYNYSQINAQLNSGGTEFYWQNGMAQNDALITLFNAGSTAVSMNTAANAGVSGFTLVDTSGNPLGNPVAITATSNATSVVVSTATTTGLVANQSIVRLSGVAAAQDICGIDFLVTAVNAGVSFTLQTLATAPGAVGGAGFYRIVNYPKLFQPQTLIMANADQANPLEITTTIPHNLTVGQQLRFNIPAASGMSQLNGLSASVQTVASATAFFVNISSAAFSAFTFPTAAQMPSSFPQVIPYGENSIVAPNNLADAVENTGLLGVVLAPGITGPAGQNTNVMYWIAGKSFNI